MSAARSKPTYCGRVVRCRRNLTLAVEVLCKEGLVRQPFNTSATDCKGLEREWKAWCSRCTDKRKDSVRSLTLKSAIKGCKTLFDEPCKKCDGALKRDAKRAWLRKACGEPRTTDSRVLADIRSRAREMMGTRWFKERQDDSYLVPDQQGCLEMKSMFGGTMSVGRWFEEDVVAKEERLAGPCRLGAAKTKGKLRVVTMQGARVKRILRPVHTSAYRRLTAYTWLVRGNVTEEHFNRVCDDLRPGEVLISGDYTASTDNLNQDAVNTVVDVLCEALPVREKEVLSDSYHRVSVAEELGGEQVPVVRGSMMGNLLSFVVLCILNKICIDIARQKVYNCGPYYRPCLVNGDDCLFAGNEEMYNEWLRATAAVGFEINRDKTMRSDRFCELNSQYFDRHSRALIRKHSFGFLGSDDWKDSEGSMASCVFELADQLKYTTATWLLTTKKIRRLFERNRPAASEIPRRWRHFLLRKNWFRQGLVQGWKDWTVVTSGDDRSLPFEYGPPVKESKPVLEKRIKALENAFSKALCESWRGKCAEPLKRKMVPDRRRTYDEDGLPFGHKIHVPVVVKVGPPEWKRLWMKPVLERIKKSCPWILDDSPSEWVDEQPGLVTVRAWEFSKPRYFYAPDIKSSNAQGFFPESYYWKKYPRVR